MSKHILLTGGTGLVGTKLTRLLLDKGYSVSHLSRRQGNVDARVHTYLWDVNKGEIDEHSLDGVDVIVHLAGANVAEGRWTDDRKKEIIRSRTKSIGLIYNLMKDKKSHTVTAVISASATGYYGDRGDELLTEDSAPGSNFLSDCCLQWEHAADTGESLGLRVVKLRTGVVLDAKGGALAKLAAPVKFGFGSPLGNGRQWIPWIHEEDVVDMYLFAIENEALKGDYNLVAPNPVTNKQLTQAVARQLRRPLWLPKVPAFALALVLGEMSIIVLGSDKVSSQKIEDAGFKFKYPTLTWALKELYAPSKPSR